MPPAGYPAFLQYLQSGRVRIPERAEALLHLRCIELNGDWENFITWTYQQYQDQLRDRQAVQIRTDEPMLLPRAA